MDAGNAVATATVTLLRNQSRRELVKSQGGF
jgi:hypothetical protein